MLNTNSIWNAVKTLINRTAIGDTISRKQLIAEAAEIIDTQYSIDAYRLNLTHAGYLERTSPGKFVVLKHIDEKLSSGKLRLEMLAAKALMKHQLNTL